MENTSTEPRPVRRVVTGERPDGRSFIAADGPAPNRTLHPGSPSAQVVWATGQSAAPGDDPAPAGHVFGFHSTGGTVLRIVDFLPDEEYDREALGRFLDENDVRDRHTEARHPGFHTTPTLDYAIVLDGEIYALMDDGETLMRAGDVLVQRATHHSWSNRSARPCRMAFVLIDTAPRPT
jgi:mannose-6-phosphate isomerase-like protein (cupin superfamily)